MNKPKTQAHQSYYYDLTNMVLFGKIEIVSGSGVLDTDYFFVDDDIAASGLTLFMVPRTPIGAVDISAVMSGLNSDSDGDSDSTTVPAYKQADSAIRVDNSAAPATWTDVSAAVLQASDYGSAGDLVELIGIANPETDGLWTSMNYIRSFDVTPGQSIEPVPSEMEPQLTTRRIRQEQTFDLSGEYIDNNTGIPRIRGMEVCLMVEQHEDGGPVVSEYWVLGNAAVQDAPVSAPDNAPQSISASGSYRRRLIYTP